MAERYELFTKNGHLLQDMVTMLQNAIRRCDYQRAGYAANELFPKYRAYLWRRLFIISAEDCFGIITKEILALKQAEDADKDKTHTIFVSKAITLLCYARKNEDADYFACNLMNSDTPIPEDQIEHVPIEECDMEGGELPDYAYNYYTKKGRAIGRDVVDQIVGRQKNLTPHQPGLFDDENWENDIKTCLTKFNPKNRPLVGVDWSEHGGSAGKQFPPGANLPKIAGQTTVQSQPEQPTKSLSDELRGMMAEKKDLPTYFY
ncbi:MAG: hypothetical protein LBC76_08325 [Treponema sp.]|jgi:replication-associated recombination protein RarA|nr:hypothetical protein [Treponema sp.]